MIMLDKVIAYENRLLEDRKQLNDLIAEWAAGNTDAMVGMKIEELQREIDFMARQAAILRSTVQRMPVANGAVQQMMPNRQIPSGPEPMMPPRPEQMPPGPEPMPQHQAHLEKRADLEKTIGKSVMGICASVLIFISLISFAVLILPYLSNAVKMTLMYAVSLIFTVAGILLLGKDRNNKLFLSLAGCGTGALYISLFMSCFYFKAMNDTALYVCIFCWSVLVCVLSRLRSGIFLIIGQIGIALSILLGVCLCGVARDGQKLLFLVVYSVLSETVFYISSFDKKYNHNLINHVFWGIGLLLLMPGVNARYMSETVQGAAAGILIVLVCCLLIVCSITILRTEAKQTIAFGVFNSAYLLIAYITFCHWFGMYFAVLGAMAILLAALEWRITEAEHIGKVVLRCVLFLLIFSTAMQVGWLREYVSTFLFAAICLTYGFYRKDTVYKIAGMGYAILFVIIPMNCYLQLTWGLCLTACTVWLTCHYREQYRTWMKMAAYPMLMVLLTEDAVRIMGELAVEPTALRRVLILAILAALNAVMLKVPMLYKKIQTGEIEQAFLIEVGAIQIALMWMSLYCIEEAALTWLHTPAVLLSGVVFMANSYGLLRKYRVTWPGIYVATKIVFFAIAALRSYETPDFAVSLAILTAALACIALGFLADRRWRQNFRTVRIYGLVLAFLGMIKLILIDIHYDSTLMRTVGFFLSGVMCFAISMIYNMVDRQMTKEQQGETETEQDI